MSVVKDILGVSGGHTLPTPVSNVMSTIGITKSEATPPEKKRKSFAARMESKLVASLRDSMNPVATPEPHSSSRHWKWAPFTNSAHDGDLTLHHWDYEKGTSTDYAGAKWNVKSDVASVSCLSENEKNQLVDKFCLSSIDELHYIFDLIQKLELRFVVVLDKINEDRQPALKMEDLKNLYYTVYTSAWPSKKCKFSHILEKERRTLLHERFETIATEGLDNLEYRKKDEKRLVAELKELEQKSRALVSDFSPIESLVKEKPLNISTNSMDAFLKLCVPSAQNSGGGNVSLLKTKINFSCCVVPPICSKFESPEISDFLSRVTRMIEVEKQLQAFIKRKEAEIKALKKP